MASLKLEFQGGGRSRALHLHLQESWRPPFFLVRLDMFGCSVLQPHYAAGGGAAKPCAFRELFVGTAERCAEKPWKWQPLV